jgi:hypothetical protein
MPCRSSGEWTGMYIQILEKLECPLLGIIDELFGVNLMNSDLGNTNFYKTDLRDAILSKAHKLAW